MHITFYKEKHVIKFLFKKICAVCDVDHDHSCKMNESFKGFSSKKENILHITFELEACVNSFFFLGL